MFKTAQGQTTSVPDIARKIFEIIMSDKTNSYAASGIADKYSK